MANPFSGVKLAIQRFPKVVNLPGRLAFAILAFVSYVPNVMADVADYFGGVPAEVFLAAAIAIWILFEFYRFNRNYSAKQKQIKVGSQSKHLASKRAAVVTLGLHSADAESELTKFLSLVPNLEYIAFLGTAETAENKVLSDVVSKIINVFTSIKKENIRAWENANSLNMKDFYTNGKDAIDWLISQGVASEEILVEVSAGRRPMVFGAQAAGQKRGIEVVYLGYTWDHLSRTAIKTSQVPVVLETPVD